MNPLDFLNAIGSLASIASLLRQLISREASKEEIRAALASVSPVDLDTPAARRTIRRIGKDVLDPYKKRIDKAKQRYIDVINDPAARPYDLRDARERAEYEICAVLDLLMQHNQGSLPGAEFERLWKEYSCDKNTP